MTTAVTVDPEIPGQESILDTDAPYGRKADGTPKGKPGRKASPTPPPVSGAVPPPRARSTRSSAAKGASAARGGTDYTPGLMGLLQIVVTPLAVAGQKSDPLMADAATLALHGPNLVAQLNDLAQDTPALANAFDRLLAVGPYAGLAMALTTIGVQLAANHGAVPAGMAQQMGAQDPAELANSFRAQTQAAVQQQMATAA